MLISISIYLSIFIPDCFHQPLYSDVYIISLYTFLENYPGNSRGFVYISFKAKFRQPSVSITQTKSP